MLSKLLLFIFATTFVIGCAKHSETLSGQPPADPTPTKKIPLPSPSADTSNLQGFAVIREFGGTDTAALFILISGADSVNVSSVSRPGFLGAAHVGKMTPSVIDHLFSKSSKPLSIDERQDLISKYNGAEAIYFEGYNGKLCVDSDTEFEISAVGTLNNALLRSKFQFIALASDTGDCTFDQFGLVTIN